MRIVSKTFIAIAALVLATPAFASDDQSLCTAAAKKAEQQHSIPDKLLQAISIVETSRDGPKSNAAWPWTVNIAGRGHYFKTASDARAFVQEKAKLGARSMDIGCFQINTKWHGKSFQTVDKMFDPEAGANYAASFLKNLKAEFGDWDKAVKNYHSRTATKGARYGQKVSAVAESIRESEKTAETPMLFTSTAPISQILRGGVELVIFAPASPLVGEAPPRPIIPTENSAWK